jgi:hypothetical protein
MIGIRIEGLDSLQRKLGRDITPELRGFTKAVAEEVKGIIAPYPPASEANFPVYHFGPHRKPSNYGRWYTRGYGPQWSRKDGSVGGTKSSEMMNRQWGIRALGQSGQVVGNRASYANWVHAAADQTAFHKKRGWVTDVAAVQRVVSSGVIGKLWGQVMRKLWT